MGLVMVKSEPKVCRWARRLSRKPASLSIDWAASGREGWLGGVVGRGRDLLGRCGVVTQSIPPIVFGGELTRKETVNIRWYVWEIVERHWRALIKYLSQILAVG